MREAKKAGDTRSMAGLRGEGGAQRSNRRGRFLCATRTELLTRGMQPSRSRIDFAAEGNFSFDALTASVITKMRLIMHSCRPSSGKNRHCQGRRSAPWSQIGILMCRWHRFSAAKPDDGFRPESPPAFARQSFPALVHLKIDGDSAPTPINYAVWRW